MAGILANSASKTMVSGDTSANDVESGYVAGEKITLSTTPTGTDYVWGLAQPSASAPARAFLNDTTAASPTFIPDVAGEYVITCVVDSTTTYVIRCTVVAVTVAGSVGGIRYMPVADASVPTPPSGATLYYSSDSDALAVKHASGYVSDPTSLPTQHFNVGKLGSPAVAASPGTPDTAALSVFSQFNIPRDATITAVHLHGIEDQGSGSMTVELYRRRSAAMTLLGSASLTGGGGDYATGAFTISDSSLSAGDYLFCQLTAYVGAGGYDGVTIDVHLSAASI